MLEVVKRKQDVVEGIYRQDSGLFLQTRKGLLRLKPLNPSIVRVTYTQRDAVAGTCGVGILEEQDWDGWEYEEQETKVLLHTEKLVLEIGRAHV